MVKFGLRFYACLLWTSALRVTQGSLQGCGGRRLTFPAGPLFRDGLPIARWLSPSCAAGETGVSCTHRMGALSGSVRREGGLYRTSGAVTPKGPGEGRRPARRELGTAVREEPKPKVGAEELVTCIRHPRGVAEVVPPTPPFSSDLDRARFFSLLTEAGTRRTAAAEEWPAQGETVETLQGAGEQGKQAPLCTTDLVQTPPTVPFLCPPTA